MAKYEAPALDKGLDILEFLSAQSIPQSQLEIATGIGRKSNEIYRMLIGLESRGYVVKDPVSAKYNLTLRLFQLAHHHSTVDTIVKASEHHMIHLSQKINQSVHISVLYNNKLLVIGQAQSQTPVSLSVEIGSLFPLHKTISGKVILANLSTEKRARILKEIFDQEKLDRIKKTELDKNLALIQNKKCVNQKSELTEGVTDFSSPILNMHNEIVAVLAVSTLTSQMRKTVSTEVIEHEITETVAKISSDLGLL